MHIITGHRRAGKEYDIDFKALVNTKGTLVFLMGIAALSDICFGLLEAGMDPAMPAAAAPKGNYGRVQKRVVATVATTEGGSRPPGDRNTGNHCCRKGMQTCR